LFRDLAPPAYSPMRGFGGDGARRRHHRRIPTMSPNKLTETELGILSAASQREDYAIELAPNGKGNAARKVFSKLLAHGLIEEIEARGSLPAWRDDDDRGPLALRIWECD
jgi:hypothetical protein